MVLPEDLCARLAVLAEQESRTVSNMARVLIQQGVQRHEQGQLQGQAQMTGSPQAPAQPAASMPPAAPSAQAFPVNPSLNAPSQVGDSTSAPQAPGISNEERLRALENQPPRRLRGAPRRLRLQRPDQI